ncbi:MAG: universal stress protein [Kofleriaceae bacterium]
MQHVVVPTDLSPGAELALARALALSLPPAATLHLLHVAREEKHRPGAQAAIGQIVSRAVASRGLDVRVAIRVGAAHAEIVDYARGVEADLIALGSHGRSTLRDLLIGTTAARVVRAGAAPVLVAARSPASDYRRPLVAIDVEAPAPGILEAADRMISPIVEEIEVLSAIRVPFEGLVAPGEPRTEPSAYRAACEQAALEQLRALVPVGGERRWTPIVRVGDARTVVVEEVRARGTDLLVVGTHARTGLAHALLGSVAESILEAAPCDVLVVPPRAR